MSALLTALLAGALFAAGAYLTLQRSLVRLVFGLGLIAQAINVLVFAAAGVVRGAPPIAADGSLAPPPGSADPVPQALVLTAIVIGFAITAFSAVLVQRVHRETGRGDADALREDAE